jgi:hypothetical protein
VRAIGTLLTQFQEFEYGETFYMREVTAEQSLARSIRPTSHQVVGLCLNLILSSSLITVPLLPFLLLRPPSLPFSRSENALNCKFAHQRPSHSRWPPSPPFLAGHPGKDLVPLTHEGCHWDVVVCRVGEFARRSCGQLSGYVRCPCEALRLQEVGECDCGVGPG